MTRRTFGKSVLAATLASVGAHLGDVQSTKAQSPEETNNLTPAQWREERGKADFVWPTQLIGNESFLGSDIYLTIDDCNFDDHTRKMMDILIAAKAGATFFPNSGYLSLSDPGTVQLWQQIHRHGFDIGYHTQYHPNEMSVSELKADFDSFTDHMRKLLADPEFSIQFVRPPYGNWNYDWNTWVEQNGLTTVKWNIVPNNDTSMDYVDGVRRHDRGGGIILLHPRVFDVHWLSENIVHLTRLAEDSDGLVTSLTGQC